MSKSYAGIGSRKLTTDERRLCYDIGKWLALQGWHLHTGAAKGADQAFAEGALSVNGQVTLCLPWPSYEAQWVQALGEGINLRPLMPYDDAAFDSVDLYHPAPDKLSSAVRKLHARNFLILDERRFVIAFPKPGRDGALGGTGQGLRIAEGLDITALRLDQEEDRKRIEKKVYAK